MLDRVTKKSLIFIFSLFALGQVVKADVKYMYVSAEKNGMTIDIKWATETEVNSELFTIQRATDGGSWEDIAMVESQANVPSGGEYYVQDDAPPLGMVYYRIQQQDFDGSFTYTEMMTVSNNFVDDDEVLLYPNPAGEVFSVELENSNVELTENVTLNLLDVKGSLIQVEWVYQGGSIQVFPQGLTPGMYFLKLEIDEQVIMKKLTLK